MSLQMDNETDTLFTQQLSCRLSEPCTLIILGVTGDLAARKLIPALYNLSKEGRLPKGFRCIGFARRPKSDEEIRSELKEAVEKFSRTGINEDSWESFAKSISYHQSEFGDKEGYASLEKKLSAYEKEQGLRGNRIFYLSTAPSFFPTIVENLKTNKLTYDRLPRWDKQLPWSRIIVEKPFGHDLKSAQELERHLSKHLHERQIYRIDHYLGKETVQNLLVFRFGNHIFESLWSNRHIEDIQITVSEDLGIGRRGAFYEEAGQLRDVMQNHMMQLLALVAMEPPASLTSTAIHNEKVKVMDSIRPIQESEVDQFAVRGQYDKGFIQGDEVRAYRDEDHVSPNSNVETFAALKLFIDNWRWHGVPIYLRTGKRMAKRTTDIAITFKKTPGVLFRASDPAANVFWIRIQPDEAISLKINCKVPGLETSVQPVTLNFDYDSQFQTSSPEAYERLLLDCIQGDRTLFARNDEVLASWKLLSPILEKWAKSGSPHLYPAGSWGPPESEELLRKEGHSWCHPC